MPPDAKALSEQCAAIPDALSQGFGREVSAPICELRTVAGHHATYVQTEGPMSGTAILQYQIQLSQQDVLAMTATVLARDLASMRAEFDSIVNSLRLDQAD